MYHMQLTLSSRHVKFSYVSSINVRACHMNSIYISYDIGLRQFLPLYTFYMYIKTSLRLKYNDLKKATSLIQGSRGGFRPHPLKNSAY